MPMCGWCGRLTAQAKEFQNGSTVLRLCAECAQHGIGRQSAELLRQAPPPDEDAIPGPPAWVRATALVVLVSVLLPVGLALWWWIYPS
jgi:hypothetical protein